jgi:hypothetical protein
VTAAGWVGIGTTSPAVRFNVVGDSQLQSAVGGFIFQVQSAGFLFSSGSTGSVYYKDSFGYFVPTTSGSSSQYLKGGTAPTWSTIDASHITTGTLPLSIGGTGSSLSNPGANRILYHNGSVVTWLSTNSTLSIATATLGVAVPLTLTHSVTANSPTFTVDHTLGGSATIANDYAQQIIFRHNHAGSISPGTGARIGLSMIWDHLNGGTGGIGTLGDTMLEMYARNTGSIYTGAYKLTGITFVSYLPTVISEFTAIRINGVNATTRRAIVVENGGGDVVINQGASLATNAKHGFLYIPVMDNPPNNSGDSITGVVPVGTCAIVICKSNNALYANYGTGWMKISFGGYL